MLFVTRNFVVDRTAGALELLRQDGITGPRAVAGVLWYAWINPGMFRKIFGAWVSFFLPGFHPWNEDDRALIADYETQRRVRRRRARAQGPQRAEPRPRANRRVTPPALRSSAASDEPEQARHRFAAARAAVARRRGEAGGAEAELFEHAARRRIVDEVRRLRAAPAGACARCRSAHGRPRSRSRGSSGAARSNSQARPRPTAAGRSPHAPTSRGAASVRSVIRKLGSTGSRGAARNASASATP